MACGSYYVKLTDCITRISLDKKHPEQVRRGGSVGAPRLWGTVCVCVCVCVRALLTGECVLQELCRVTVMRMRGEIEEKIRRLQEEKVMEELANGR